MDYSFNGKIAEMYGVDEAVFIHNLYWWIAKNEANGRHFYDGRNWTYNSMEAFAKLFPFWSIKQVRRIIKNLYEAGAIYTGNYNQRTYDRTQWYALSESALALYQTGADKCLNGHMEVTETAQTAAHTGTPIPDIKPSIKPINKPDINTGDKSPRSTFVKPSVSEISDYCSERRNAVDPQRFFDFYESKGWVVGKTKMENWKACVRTWEQKGNYGKPNKKDGYTQSLNLASIEDEALFHTPTL